MLYLLEVPYNSKQAYKITDKIYEFIKNIAIDESKNLAEEKGIYPAWEGSIWQKENIKIRNCNHISIAPNGSIGFIADSTGGIESEYALVYYRTTNEGTKYFVVNKIFKEKLKEINLYTDELLQKIVDNNGSIQNIKEIPSNIRKVFIVSHDLTPNEHLKTLSIINKHVDLSISKCVAEGTLIQTNKGVIPIEKLGQAKGIDIFDEPLGDLMVIDENGEWKKVTKHYSGGKQKTKKMYLDNGNIIEGTLVHKIKTLNGWRQLKDIELNDYIECRFADYENRKGNLLLPELIQENITNNNIFKIPKKMNKDFALFLGMICADGSLVESTGAVQLTCADDEVEKLFIKLSQKLFDINPRITYDKRTKNTRAITLTSRALTRWLKDLIGNNCTDKFIPFQILQGSIEEQKSFLRGITLDGYIKKLEYNRNEFCIYEGYSEKLADGIMAICFLLGLSPYKNTKYVKDGRSHNMTYGIIIDSNEIIPLEKHKFSMCSSKRRLVAVPEEIKELKLSTKHEFYNSLRTIRNNGYTVVYNTTLDKARFRYNNEVYYVRVKDIVNSEANVYDIEVEDTHSYLINGVISHNTINLLNSATKEEISEIYIEAWKNNIKGVTVYRDGSRKNQVLSTSQNKDNKINKLPRGYILPALTETKGHRIKLSTGCGNLWLMVFTDENNDIVETFINTGSKGGCTISTQAMSRLMSLSLRGGISFEDVVDQLESAGSCPSYQFARGNGSKISSGKSCPSAIAKALDKLQKKLKKGEQINTIEIEEETRCSECNTKLRFIEGCNICPNCGLSKCN
jgi:ribonucleoside-diphosphate reductase alpha chain